MSATAPVEVAATLATSSVPSDREPVAASRESGEAFNKVLNELTAKSVNEPGLDRRDVSSKSTKRNRTANLPAPSVPASSLEAISVPDGRDTAVTVGPTRRTDGDDTHEPATTPAPLNDDLAGSWHTASPDITEVEVGTGAPAEVDDARTASVDESIASATSLSATIVGSLSTPLTMTARTASEAQDDDAAGDKPTAASNASVSSALSADVSSSAAPAGTALPSTFSAASAAIRTALPTVATSTAAQSDTPRTEPDSSTSPGAAASIPRRAEVISVSTDRTYGNLGVGPNMGLNARATVSAAPSASSSEVESSLLDVSDLASSISQATLGPDGNYTINVAMHPSDLGHVQAVVSLSGADLHVAITPQTPLGHAALASAVESLKSELSRSGLNVNVSLRDPESQSGRGHETAPRAVANETDLPIAESEAPSLSESLTVSQIHLIL